jgi:hypothetical protein
MRAAAGVEGMVFDVPAVVLAAARFGYKRYGVKGALLFGGGVGGLYYLWRHRRARGE